MAATGIPVGMAVGDVGSADGISLELGRLEGVDDGMGDGCCVGADVGEALRAINAALYSLTTPITSP